MAPSPSDEEVVPTTTNTGDETVPAATNDDTSPVTVDEQAKPKEEKAEEETAPEGNAPKGVKIAEEAVARDESKVTKRPTAKGGGHGTKAALSATSAMYDIDGDGQLDETEKAMRDMDKSGRGFLTNQKVYGLMEEHLELQKKLFTFKKVIIGLVVFVVILALANLGTSMAAATLAKDTTTNAQNQLVSKNTNEILGTQSTSEKFQLRISEGEDEAPEEEGSAERRIQVSLQQYTVPESMGNTILADCDAGKTVELRREWAYDGSYTNIPLCPQLGTYKSDGSGGYVKAMFRNGITFQKVGKMFQLDGDALTQDDGEVCDNHQDCDSNNCSSNVCGGPGASLDAESSERAVVRSRDESGNPRLVEGNLGRLGRSIRPDDRAGIEFATVDVLGRLAKEGVLGERTQRSPPQFVAVEGNNGRRGTNFAADGSAQIKMLNIVEGLEVEGAALMVHVKPDGSVAGINGEIVSGEGLPSESVPRLARREAMEKALAAAGLSGGEWLAAPEQAMVRTPRGNVCRAWKAQYAYEVEGEEGVMFPQVDLIYAEDTTGDLCAQFPQVIASRRNGSWFKRNAPLKALQTSVAKPDQPDQPSLRGHQERKLAKPTRPSIETYNCNYQTTVSGCTLVSSSINVLNTGDESIDKAHNFALETFDLFLNRYGRNGMDGNGKTMVSRVHWGQNLLGAWWDGTAMTYTDGNGVRYGPISREADVVGHEFTHGFTGSTAGFIYRNESGALSEAVADIFGVIVDFQTMGIAQPDKWVWGIGEDVMTPLIDGDVRRNMSDPIAAEGLDHYNDRYIGTDDSGGVHWNSGIMELAYYLLCTGGTHPRGKSDVVVNQVGATHAEGMYIMLDIIYNAVVSCLTPDSTFAAMRYCLADVHGGQHAAEIHKAFDAVGVPNDFVPPPPDPVQCAATYDSCGSNDECCSGVCSGKGKNKSCG